MWPRQKAEIPSTEAQKVEASLIKFEGQFYEQILQQSWVYETHTLLSVSNCTRLRESGGTYTEEQSQVSREGNCKDFVASDFGDQISFFP